MNVSLPRTRTTTSDPELVIIGRIADLLAMLEANARRRVWDYLSARIDTLPVLVQVAANGADDTPLFADHETQGARHDDGHGGTD